MCTCTEHILLKQSAGQTHVTELYKWTSDSVITDTMVTRYEGVMVTVPAAICVTTNLQLISNDYQICLLSNHHVTINSVCVIVMLLLIVFVQLMHYY